MGFSDDVIAGCAPGTPECADQTTLPGIDTWFVLLVTLPLVLAVVAGAALLVRRELSRRSEAASRTEKPTARTQVPMQ